jgi:hypothetical protein
MLLPDVPVNLGPPALLTSASRRHGDRLPAVLRPLRDVSARELALVCSHWRLPLALTGGAGDAPTQRAAKKNINALAAAFISGMEAHNPGKRGV